MFLKPKNTALLPKALVFKRYTHIESSFGGTCIYKTIPINDNDTFNPQYFVWNKETFNFVNVTEQVIANTFTGKIVDIGGTQEVARTLVYTDKRSWAVFRYEITAGTISDPIAFEWKMVENNSLANAPAPTDASTNADIVSSNIVVYQKNVYYYHGSFDYMLKGEKEGTKIQYIKGNILPLTSFNIKYYTDGIDLREDDLVVIDGRLFSVEDPSTDKKYSPKPFFIHYAILNNIK